MTRFELISNIRKKGSFLCVGLDSDIDKIPKHLLEVDDPVFEFNKHIIDHTSDYCVSYKLNFAFYESRGIKGLESLIKTVNYIPKDQFLIADAKRGDIGNTASMYAKAFFEEMNFDSVTISPYMGADSVKPFMEYPGKWSIVLGLTSNEGSADFQMNRISKEDGSLFLWEDVIQKVMTWGDVNNTMFVVGATRVEQMKRIREIAPNHFLLVPGFGAQGAGLDQIAPLMNKDIGILVNSSRGIIFQSSGLNFAEKAGQAASKVRDEMSKLIP